VRSLQRKERTLRKTIVLGLMAALMAAAPYATAERSLYEKITILHTNDTHGHLIPFSYPEGGQLAAPFDQLPALRDIGGIARRATLVNGLRSELDGACLLLDAGDILDGTPFTVEYQGAAAVDAMNACGYEAMVTGNHEYNTAPERFRANVQAAQFPILCANLVDAETNELVLKPYTVMNVDGVRIAVMGLTTLESADYPATKQAGWKIEDPIEIAKDLAPELQRENDIVVALTHLGYSEDLKLAAAVPDIDVIVGGHSHTRLPEPVFVPEEGAPASAFDVNGAVVVQDFQFGGELGRLDLILHRAKDGADYTIMSYDGCLIPVTNEIEEDAKVAKVVGRYWDKMKPTYGRVVAHATADFPNAGLDRPTVNLVCDALLDITGADLALHNYGGVRESLFAGDVRIWDVASMLPFSNKIVVIEATGKQVKQALQNGQEFLGLAGMNVVLDQDYNPISVSVGGKPIDDDAVYKVATIDYIHGKILPDCKVLEEYPIASRESIIAWMEQKKEISPVRDGRIKIEKQADEE
jgi:2',3'-cyclic-nucleotide 2'-phosphodiesterase (5'-nucleotidase family)